MARIPLVERPDLDPAGQLIWDDIAGARGDVPVSYRSMLNSPGVAAAVARLGAYLRFESEVEPRVRELAVLVVNHELDCEVGWVHHALLADRMGISAEAIGDIHCGRPPRGLSDDEMLGVTVAQEILRTGSASVDTVARMVERFGRTRTTDLVVAVGYYTMVAQYLLTMELVVEPDSLQHLESGADVAAVRAAGGSADDDGVQSS